MKGLLLTIGLAGSAVVLGRGVYGWVNTPQSPATVSYYGDGKPKSSVILVDGVKDGASVQWYADGQMEAQGSYVAGEREGPWTFWKSDGATDTARTGEYRAGRRTEM